MVLNIFMNNPNFGSINKKIILNINLFMSNDNQTAFIYFGSKNNIVNAKKASLTAKITLGLLTLTYSREFIPENLFQRIYSREFIYTQVWNYTDNQSMIAIYNTD
jgi:hypothetical protein